jgi:hypothetical protein
MGILDIFRPKKYPGDPGYDPSVDEQPTEPPEGLDVPANLAQTLRSVPIDPMPEPRPVPSPDMVLVRHESLDGQEPPPSMPGDDDILRQFMTPPPVKQIPEELAPKETVKGALKKTAIGMIPFFGPTYLAGQEKHRELQIDNIKAQNDANQKQWEAQQQMVRPIIQKDIEATRAIQEIQKKDLFLQTMYPWMTADDRAAWAQGHPPAAKPRPLATQPKMLQLVDGTNVMAVWNPNSNQFEGAQGAIPSQAIKNIGVPTPPQPHQPTFEEQQADTQFMKKHGLPFGDTLTKAQHDQAVAEYVPVGAPKETPPLELKPVDTPQGTVNMWFDPRKPNAPGIPATLPGGQAARPPQSEKDKTVYQPAIDADQTLSEMMKEQQGGDSGSPQDDIALLFNHMRMTIGAVKGARLNQTQINEAITARPWLQGIYAKVQAGVKGTFLTKEQRQNMIDLAALKRNEIWANARRAAAQRGIQGEPPAHPTLPAVPTTAYSAISPEELGALYRQGDRLAGAELQRRIEEEQNRRKGPAKK